MGGVLKLNKSRFFLLYISFIYFYSKNTLCCLKSISLNGYIIHFAQNIIIIIINIITIFYVYIYIDLLFIYKGGNLRNANYQHTNIYFLEVKKRRR